MSGGERTIEALSTAHLVDAGSAPRSERSQAALGRLALVVALVGAVLPSLRAAELWPFASKGSSVDPVVTAVVKLRPTLNGIVVAPNGVWVSSEGAATGTGGSPSLLWRVDPRTNRATSPIQVDNVFDVGFGYGSLWVPGAGELTRIDPRTGHVLARIPLTADSIVVGAGSVWVGRGRIDPRTNRPVPLAHPLKAPVALAGPLGVWTSGDDIRRVDPRNGRELAVVARRGFRPAALAEGDGSVWAAYASSREWELTSLVRIDPRTNRISGPRLNLRGHLPAAIAVADGFVWLLTHNGEEQGARLWQVDPSSNTVVGRPLHLPHGTPFLLAAGKHTLWVAEDLDEGTVTRVDLR